MVLDPPTKPHQVPDLRQRDVRETKRAPVTSISYLSIPATGFKAMYPDTNDVVYGEGFSGDAGFSISADNITLQAPVYLPHGVIVTACVVYGNAGATAESWKLLRSSLNSNAVDADMATANIGTEDKTITSPTIDNNAYDYFISTSTLDTGDSLWSARITYTIED